MKNIILTTALCILFSLPVLMQAQNPESCEFTFGTYAQHSNMPVKAAQMVSGEIDGKFYLTCGFTFVDEVGVDIYHMSVYDPESDTWDTTGAHIPFSRYMQGATNSVLDGKLYVVGGITYVRVNSEWQAIPHSRVDVYDPQADTWELKANLPLPLGLNGICSMDGKLYVSGGLSTAQESLKGFYSYDPDLDKWTELTELTTPRSSHASVAVSGKIYVIGGSDKAMKNNLPSVESGEVYDPETGLWTPIAPLPKGSIWSGTCVIDDEIYIIGGIKDLEGNIDPFNSVYKYNPAADTWIRIDDLPIRLGESSAFALGRKIYFIGGRMDADGWNINPLVYTYELGDVRLDALIPDTLVENSIQLDLSEYFSHVDGGDITYSVCHDDAGILDVSLQGSQLTVTKLASGEEEIHILAESGEDQMGDAFQVSTTSVGIYETCETTPILHIYPNPARGMVTLAYSVKYPGEVRLEVYNLVGKRIAIPVNEYRIQGEYEHQLDTDDLVPGIYICKLKTANERVTAKLMVE